ncbi:hypothetical protein [Okeania sp.]|uniref:hypothetical protein n=1 Tax=Okeania sp. TaxID=3100323 RepID=UPI002B4B5F52|nr:hypothetical protein [Okeania sp.]MEB3343184.1 hypothetical protein [Okeania sp.]
MNKSGLKKEIRSLGDRLEIFTSTLIATVEIALSFPTFSVLGKLFPDSQFSCL